MRTINNILHLEIGKDINRTATPQATDPTAASFIADGEIVVTDVDGTVLDSTTVLTKDRVVIRQGQGTSLPQIVSPVIRRKAVTSYSAKNYTAATQQVDYIGYNAATATGAWEVINNNDYVVTITNINSPNYGSIGIQKLGFYKSDASATKLEINDAVAISLYQNTTRTQFQAPFKVERVSSDAGVATNASTGTISAVNGAVTFVTSGGTPSTDFPVGTYVRFGTATTSPIYKIVAVDDTGNGTITIDMPYQGATASFVAGAAEYITNALALAGEVGIKLTGIAQTFDEVRRFQYIISRWQTNIINGGTTTITAQTTPNPGIGTYEQIAEIEYMAVGYEGFIHRDRQPYIAPRKNALSTAKYSVVNLTYADIADNGIAANTPNMKELMLAFAVNSVGSPNTYLTQSQGVVTSVVTVLNAWIGTTPGPFTDITLA